MNGNVNQWLQDCFSPSYAGLPTDGSAYEVDVELKAADQDLHKYIVDFCSNDALDGKTNDAKLQECVTGMTADLNGTRSCFYRMARSGDWGDPPKEIRTASRGFGSMQESPSAGWGFRVARTLD
jgi:formylglycine-generating enzyme required for sulfatase activity